MKNNETIKSLIIDLLKKEGIDIVEDNIKIWQTQNMLANNVTEFPRNENVNPFQFVYGLFEKLAPSVFANNQDSIISLASELFADAKPLDTFESNVLDRTFKRLLMSQPTLSGRK